MTKRSLLLAASMILFSALTGAQNAQDAPKPVDVTGTWESTVESPQGTYTSVATYKQSGEQLTGTHVGQFGELQLREGTVKGSTITYKVALDLNGQQLTITYSGKVDGDRISGTADFGGMGSGAWTVNRKK